MFSPIHSEPAFDVAKTPYRASKTPYPISSRLRIVMCQGHVRGCLVPDSISRPDLARGLNGEAFSYYARLTPVARFVEAHVSKPISLDDAAKLAGLEKKYFSSFFHSKVGTTFTEWVRIIRVNRAMELMRAQEDSIPRIAFAAGFRDVRTFERAFKRLVGLTPKVYRSSVRPGSREMPQMSRVTPRRGRKQRESR